MWHTFCAKHQLKVREYRYSHGLCARLALSDLGLPKFRGPTSYPAAKLAGHLLGRGLSYLGALALLFSSLARLRLVLAGSSLGAHKETSKLIFWLIQPAEQSFALKAVSLPKFLKKKLRQSVSIEPARVPPSRRAPLALRQLALGLEHQPCVRLKQRLYLSLLDLGSNRLKSAIFRRKLSTYTIAMRRFKQA